jgi:hypothetical protein
MKIILLKLLVLIVLCVFTMKNSSCQTNKIDSLHHLLEASQADTNKLTLLIELGYKFKISNPDLFLKSMQDALLLSEKLNYAKGEFSSRLIMLRYWWEMGDYSAALKITLPMIRFIENNKNNLYGTLTYASLASIYRDTLEYAYQSLHFERLLQSNNFCSLANAVVASI